MNRFHPSMSWESPSEASDPCEAADAGSDSWQDITSKGCLGGSDASGNPDGCAAPGASLSTPRVFLVPVHYEPNYRYPLVIWLHSDGFNEHQVEQVMPHVSLRNYVAAGIRGVRAADSMGHRYDWASSPAAIEAAHEAVSQTVADASRRYSIHPDRVVLAGYRSGGSMALRLAMREPDAFAGVVSLGGALPADGRLFSDLHAIRRRRLPMLWQWAQRSDGFDPQQLSLDIRSAMWMQARVEIRQYEDDDEMNTVTLADLNDWMMRNVVSGSQAADSDRWATSEVRFSSN